MQKIRQTQWNFQVIYHLRNYSFTQLHQALHKVITSYIFMTEAFLQYSSELSSSRITAATRVRYVNKQLMVYWQLPNLVDHSADPPNLRLEAISPVVVVDALLASFVILQITSTFTNTDFVPIWYIWIAVSAIGTVYYVSNSRAVCNYCCYSDGQPKQSLWAEKEASLTVVEASYRWVHVGDEQSSGTRPGLHQEAPRPIILLCVW